MRNIFASSTIGAQLLLLISIISTVFAINNYGLSVESCGLIVLGYFMYGCMGIAAMYHRYLTHKSYDTHPFIVKLFSLLGCFAGTGSPIAWVAIHINHHLKSDKPGDPHSPYYRGAGMFTLDYEFGVDPTTKWRMREMITDRYQQFLHKYYFLLIVSYAVLLYIVGGYMLVTFLLLVPTTITGLMSNIVNYIGHKPEWFGGYRTYNLNDRSANNWVWALPTWGESWHNNHHRHPKQYSSGHAWYEFDVTAQVIKLIKK